MTVDPHLTHRVLVDMVIHVSEIVCLELGWLRLVSSPRASARLASPSCRRCTSPKPPERAHPDTVEPGL
jgi:hypothetical protein